MKNLFPLAICLLIGSGAHAQSTFSSASDSTVEVSKLAPTSSRKFTFTRYQWDASVDASFALPSFYQVNTWVGYGYNYGNYGNYTYGNYGYGSTLFANTHSTRFMVRKNETVRNETNIPVRKGAYRMALQLNGGNNRFSKDSVRFNGNSSSTFYFPASSASFGLSTAVGYEWQHQMGRFQFIYGYDVFANIGAGQESGFVRSGEGRKEAVSTKSNYFTTGIAPLAGVKFFVHPRFSLSLEGTYSIRYSRSRFETTRTDNIYVVRNATESGFNYGLTPLSAFNATFHFGKVVKP